MIQPTPAELAEVELLLGRVPEGEFSVAAKRVTGGIVVIENAPFLRDGRPMPTRYWLVDPVLRASVSRLESSGGVRQAEREVDPQAIQSAHERSEVARTMTLGPDTGQPRPTGGIGGTRTGVKCLHAHLAVFLIDGEDPVGAWTAARLQESGIDLVGIERSNG
ncbi:MAG: DUF501 domain-containing protein [Actinomycetota bacterium]